MRKRKVWWMLQLDAPSRSFFLPAPARPRTARALRGQSSFGSTRTGDSSTLRNMAQPLWTIVSASDCSIALPPTIRRLSARLLGRLLGWTFVAENEVITRRIWESLQYHWNEASTRSIWESLEEDPACHLPITKTIRLLSGRLRGRSLLWTFLEAYSATFTRLTGIFLPSWHRLEERFTRFPTVPDIPRQLVVRFPHSRTRRAIRSSLKQVCLTFLIVRPRQKESVKPREALRAPA
jgi:hypothetical protein